MESLQPPAHLKSRRQKELWKKQLLQTMNARKKAQESQTPFRIAERSLQSKVRTPDQPPIIDFTNLDNNPPEVREKIKRVELCHDLRKICPLLGKSDADWLERSKTAYIYEDIDGIIFIPNPFTATAQRMLIYHCLHKYTQAPNLTNLHAHYDIPPEGIWNLYRKLHNVTGKCKDDQVKIPRTSESPKRQKTTIISEVDKENSAEYPTSFEQEHDTSEVQDDTDQKVNGGSLGQKTTSSGYSTPSELMKKLRWVTLGYQYDWSNKAYDFEHRVAFPEEARMISIAVAKAVEGIAYYNEGKLQWQNTYKGEDFVPEAGIVNYYQLKDTLMAHVDRSELNMAAPLVSISLGHSCIYLIGGQTRDTAPHAVLLQSGDVMVMTGSGRGAYHGVPRILESGPAFLQPDIEDAQIPDWHMYGEYISNARINLNIRQVNMIAPAK